MSRSGYSEDCEYLNLWRANVDRTIRSKRGQIFLMELLQALDDMPEKRLIRDSLVNKDEVCTLGAFGVKRGINMENLDPEDPEQVGSAFGISSMLAQEIVFENDERHSSQTPEERWLRMRTWISDNLKT